MAKALSRLQRIYPKIETTYGTAVAPTGAAAVRNIRMNMNNEVALLRRRDKTGTRTGVQGVRGRISARWSFEGSLVGSGTPGDNPPHDVLFSLLFGVATGTAGAYALTDVIKSASLWSYRRPSTVEQQVAIGSILQNFEFTLGQDVAEWRCDGESMYVLDSTNFATADTIAKGGLGAFPAEPTPVYTDGGLIAGFTGAISIGGQTLANFRQCTIRGNTGNALPHDVFNRYYGGPEPEGDERQFTFSFNAYDDDAAGLGVLKEAADKKTPVDASVQIGTVAGSIATFTVKGIQLASQTLDDTQRSYIVTFPDSQFKGSDPSLLDELALAFT